MSPSYPGGALPPSLPPSLSSPPQFLSVGSEGEKGGIKGEEGASFSGRVRASLPPSLPPLFPFLTLPSLSHFISAPSPPKMAPPYYTHPPILLPIVPTPFKSPLPLVYSCVSSLPQFHPPDIHFRFPRILWRLKFPQNSDVKYRAPKCCLGSTVIFLKKETSCGNGRCVPGPILSCFCAVVEITATKFVASLTWNAEREEKVRESHSRRVIK